MNNSVNLEAYFEPVRKGIIGIDAEFDSPYGKQKTIYADWIASGRLFEPIEHRLSNSIGPFVANTHTETTETGLRMTKAYHEAHHLIKKHVNACEKDVIITAGFGMTGAISKLIRILGLSIPEQLQKNCTIPDEDKPVVFITHMEHHSNQLPWLESIADMFILPYGDDLLVDLELTYIERIIAKIESGNDPEELKRLIDLKLIKKKGGNEKPEIKLRMECNSC